MTEKYANSTETVSPDGKYLAIGAADLLATQGLTARQQVENQAQAALDRHNRELRGSSPSGMYHTQTDTYWGFVTVYELETGKMIFTGADDRARAGVRYIPGNEDITAATSTKSKVMFYPSFNENGTILTVKFGPAGNIITDSWDTATWKPVANPEAAVYQGDYSPDGRYVYYIYDEENTLIAPTEYFPNGSLTMVLKNTEGKELWRKSWIPEK
jgi:hypothetical protein